MYNRYVPQSDGSYQRRPCKDSPHNTIQPPPGNTTAPVSPPPPPPPKKLPDQRPHSQEHAGAGTFLKNLLPGDFDTGDLMILLLLLLIAGDCPEDRNTAWLTLALYFFL